MARTKAELYEENRALRGTLGEIYDRLDDFFDPDDDDAEEEVDPDDEPSDAD